MRQFALAMCGAVLCFELVHAQAPSRSSRPTLTRTDRAATLPVRRVVLYKNGVGYFEHLGKIRGNQSVSVDFNSAQLDDALKSLTALDLGTGRVSGIAYNSDAPLAQRLNALRLPVGDRTTLPELLGALRGARLEVRAGERVLTGRLLGVERRVSGTAPNQTSRDELSLLSDGGAIRTVELTPSVSVRLAERELADQVGSYLALLSSARSPDRRRLTIATQGTGERDLLVSYISEVPIWKTNYRVLLPADGEQPLLQAWAIVDNTTGEDWTDVDLSLIAGAPQSFIQHISQPRYGRRPVVQTMQAASPTPQTHDPTLRAGVGRVRGAVRDAGSAVLRGATVRVLDAQRRTIGQTVTNQTGEYVIDGLAEGTYRIEFSLSGFQPVIADVTVSAGGESTQSAVLRVGSVTETVTVTGDSPAVARASRGAAGGVEGGIVGGAVGGIVGGLVAPSPQAAPIDPTLIASRLQDLQAAAAPRELTDLFEYRLSSPISIPQNQSALVPILNAQATIERVSLWNGRVGARPLRALWLTNSTGVTLDGGTFTVLDDGVFAGEGLVDPLKPEEKRLLSYAVDLGLQIESHESEPRGLVSRVVVQRGVVIEQREQRTRRVYTIRNNDTTARAVIIEHPTRAGWTLAGGPEPVETSASAYRFKILVASKQTTTFTVEEKQPAENRYDIGSLTDDRVQVIVRDSGDNEAIRQTLQPILAKKASIARLAADVGRREAEMQQLRDDEQRVRENLQALRSTAEEKRLARRYVAQLADSADRLEALRRERADSDRLLQQAQMELDQLIEGLSLSIEIGPRADVNAEAGPPPV